MENTAVDNVVYTGNNGIHRAEINKYFTEYKIKEVPNVVHAEGIQRSPEMVF